MAAVTDCLAIFVATFLSNYIFNYIVYGRTGVSAENLTLGFFAAILFLLFNVIRYAYSMSNYLDISGHAQRTFVQWNAAFIAAAAFGFMMKALEDSSRGTFLLLYFLGLFALYSGRAAMVHVVRSQALRGGILSAQVAVVGFKQDIARFLSQRDPNREAIDVVAVHVLPEVEGDLDAALADTIASARTAMPDDIYIVVPWSRTEVIDKCISAFMELPASIHLNIDPDSVVNRLANAQIGTNGSLSSLSLRSHSMRSAGELMKRLTDIVFSATALLFLSPLFLAVAAAIKLEDGGPVLFRQRRRGFNKVEFRIFKFRTMKTMEDGRFIRQAEEGDPRITGIGAFLRRTNIDELPQLVNVFRGEMSLVGPRPHALAHDDLFEREVSMYARRHNVKPGITGWAQVNGLRGRADTPAKIANRIRFDLHYIDNWSFALDLWIIFLTIFSRRAYNNAG
ncbi:MAG: exopolysaccharide biosynthesis polyprenyl glycosylphosphotransferase [Hyphomicrobiales bacterium]|nr:exopolysaccharide biosynthesis polyprenyl glycosylphosphotransferase [Hyphomicrobiales bacterium]